MSAVHLLAPLAPEPDYQWVTLHHYLHHKLHHYYHLCLHLRMYKYAVRQVAVQGKIRTGFWKK